MIIRVLLTFTNNKRINIKTIVNNDNEMKQIKNLGIVIPLFILILGLIIARSTNKNLFKKEAQLALKEAVNNSISMDQLKQSTSDYTIIGLDGPVELENSRVIG